MILVLKAVVKPVQVNNKNYKVDVGPVLGRTTINLVFFTIIGCFALFRYIKYVNCITKMSI